MELRGIILLCTMIIASISGTIVSLMGAFGSEERLKRMAPMIGTNDPATARTVCILGLFVCPVACIAMLVLLIGPAIVGKPIREW
jgi:hypothetical protein